MIHKITQFFFSLIVLVFILFSCKQQPVMKVEVKKSDEGYQLFRAGKPYYIKGAGTNRYYEKLAQYGGNSVRTWGINDWDKAFAEAEKYGLTVCAGLWLDQEIQGFDYNNKKEVEKQFESFKTAILKYKDHPALLMWGIGNELDLFYTNPKVWDAVEEIAKFIHEVDGNHPTITFTAFIEKEEVDYIKERCPNIDILGVNAYAGIPVLKKFLDDFGWDGPYLLGEWGPFGHWEVGTTSWGEPIEHNSSEKAAIYQKAYQENIITDPNCLGGYVFLWGSKQERTATWYSMFLPEGEKTEAVDLMQYLWNDKWPKNRAPRLDSLVLNGQKTAQSIMIHPGKKVTANVFTTDPDNDSLKIVWEILYETTDKRTGGEEEEKPAKVEGLFIEQEQQSLVFKVPMQEGPYRLFVYVYDQQGSAAYANIPFFVRDENKY